MTLNEIRVEEGLVEVEGGDIILSIEALRARQGSIKVT
jgi:hypothetical protein